MRRPAHPRRTTAVIGALLALLLVAAAWVVFRSGTAVDPAPVPGAAPPVRALPAVPKVQAPQATASTTPPATRSARPAGAPRPGSAYPARRLGPLSDASVIASGRGSADLRYARSPGNGTRLHFICTGCDGDTWLVEWPRGAPVGGGPLVDPADVTAAVDTVGPGPATGIVVRAAAGADWSVTLTPFDVLPVHEQTFDALDADVVAVRARADVRVRCPGALSALTFARPVGAAEHVTGQVPPQDADGTATVRAPDGTDLIILVVACGGRWTVTLP